MQEHLAKMIIAAGFAVGLVFWFVAVVLYRRMASAPTRERIVVNIPNKTPGEALKDLIAGGKLFSPQARLTRPAENRLVVTQSRIEVTLEATRRGSGAEVTADIDHSAYTRRFALGFAAFVLIVMPAVIGGVPWALWHFAAESDSPGVRGQSLQVLQIVHVLWPPFLIYNLWNQLRRNVGNSVSNALVLAEAGG
jgi:hypothetical protein